MNDNSIIDLYWARDQLAIVETDKKYGRYCHSIAQNILDSAEDAEECVNDTWLSAWNAMPPSRPSRLAAFLGRITRNLSLNRLKSLSAEKRGGGQAMLVLSELEECIPSSHDVGREIESRELARSIEAFLRRQPEERRNIFIRRYWYMEPISDIALSSGISISRTASLLHRMRGKLREYLDTEGISI